MIEAYAYIDRNINSFKAFRLSKQSSLLETYEHERTRFGLPSNPVHDGLFGNVDHAELQMLFLACTDLRRRLSKLQWFDKVNKEASERLFRKLDQLVTTESIAHEQCRSRWLALQDSLESGLSNIFNYLDAVIAQARLLIINQEDSGTKNSLLPCRALDEHTGMLV